jgi:hypothetical protein
MRIIFLIAQRFEEEVNNLLKCIEERQPYIYINPLWGSNSKYCFCQGFIQKRGYAIEKIN